MAPKTAHSKRIDPRDPAECAKRMAPSILLQQVAKCFTFRKKVVKKVSAVDSQHALACCAGGGGSLRTVRRAELLSR